MFGDLRKQQMEFVGRRNASVQKLCAMNAVQTERRKWRLGAQCASLMLTALVANGCGGSTGSGAPNSVSVLLADSTVTVEQGGPPVNALIQIQSPSETAVVSVSGLPAGVGVKYAASDTNPSGLLTFTANSAAMKGTFMPMISVQSAGQMAATQFTLVVTME
jgi:hypothetical protein